jgi:hypothetical protein
MQLEDLTARIIREAQDCRDRNRLGTRTRVEVHVPRKVYRQYMDNDRQLATLVEHHITLLRPRNLWDRITYRAGGRHR